MPIELPCEFIFHEVVDGILKLFQRKDVLGNFTKRPVPRVNNVISSQSSCSNAKPNAIEHLRADISSYNSDVILIVESWLKSHHMDQQFNIPGYNLFRRVRMKRKGGGISIYCKQELNAQIYVPMVAFDREFELTWITLEFYREIFYIGLLYHPPKPVYATSELLRILEECIDEINARKEMSTIILAGDFNLLPDSAILSLGLISQFCEPTHCNHSLDRIYATKNIYENCRAVQSTIKTAHKAVIAMNNTADIVPANKQTKDCLFRRRSPDQNAALMSFLGDKNWSDVMEHGLGLDASFNLFYSEMNDILNQFYPYKHVRISNRDPPFITPDIKNLLRKKNNLMRRGKVESVNGIATLKRDKITKANSRILCGKKRGSKELWKAVNQCLGKNDRSGNNVYATAEDLNQFFGNISHDIKYVKPLKKLSVEVCDDAEVFIEQSVFFMLDHLRETSSGLDGLPFWYLRLAAASISAPLQYLFNQCLRQSFVPKQWKTARITPVPKVSKPVACQDYRPISVTLDTIKVI